MDFCIKRSDYTEKYHTTDKVMSFGSFKILIKEPINTEHFFFIEKDCVLYFIFGTLYGQTRQEAFDELCGFMIEGQYHSIYSIDGEFVCGSINLRTEQVVVISEREGLIPLYYRMEDSGLTITTDCSLCFHDFRLGDCDYRALNDYLRFGCLIGSETLSKKVRKLIGGSFAVFTDGRVEVKRIHRFFYQDTTDDLEYLIPSVSKAYRNAITKRISGKECNTCIFLSGGLDSRFLLAETNKAFPGIVSTYCFGQPYSDEVKIAKKCAEVGNNSFKWIALTPESFVRHAEEYERFVCGADMFPQGYILEAVQKISEDYFLTGFALDAYLGGTFLSQEAIEFNGCLSEYVSTHRKQMKMDVFSKTELQEMSKNTEIASIFDYDDSGLIEDAKNYDSIPVKDSIQAFAIENRAKNLVLLREIVPAKYKDCFHVSCDISFQKTIAHISATFRINHRFYHELFIREAPEYAGIIYNNTQLPVFSPTCRWNEGRRLEEEREKLYEIMIKEYNTTHADRIYYPHFYSDFNGYSRYDSSWLSLFVSYLFADDSVVLNNLFNREKVRKIYEEHIRGTANRRKELVYLTSLEVFFKTVIKL